MREFTAGGLSKYSNKASSFWRGSLRYRDEGGQWRTVSKVLEDEDGEAIRAYPDKADGTKDNRGRTVAERALKRWRDALMEQDKADAERAEEEALEALARAKDVTVADYVDAYLSMRAATGSIELSTYSDYLKSAKRIREAFAEKTVQELTRADVENFLHALLTGEAGRSPLAARTVTKVLRFLKMALDRAVDVDELIPRNPCHGVKPPKRSKSDKNGLCESDALRLAEYIATHEPSPIVTGCALALFAGLGTGECCGLRWRSVDFRAGTMRIDEAIGNGGAGVGYYSKEPKVKSRRRTVPLAPQLAEALRRRRDLMIEACAQMGMRLDGNAYVLGSIDGRWLAPITLSRGWSTLADAEGYKGTKGERVGFYGLRHHFATAAIAQGGDVEATAAILGHSNVAMTLDTYADASPAAKLATVERVSRALEGGNQGGAQNG